MCVCVRISSSSVGKLAADTTSAESTFVHTTPSKSLKLCAAQRAACWQTGFLPFHLQKQNLVLCIHQFLGLPFHFCMNNVRLPKSSHLVDHGAMVKGDTYVECSRLTHLQTTRTTQLGSSQPCCSTGMAPFQ